MNTNNGSSERNESNANAGFAGAGGGTFIAVIANQLPDANIAKPILQYAAPSITILISALWVYIQVKIRDKEVDYLFKKAREQLKRRIDDPNISEDHRRELQKHLEDIDSLDINRIKSRIESLKVISKDDM
jgi:hypothetical protein